MRWIFLPGIWLQGITTRQPDDSMIEVAIASMQEALAANGDEAPAGSLDPVRVPMPDAKALAADVEARRRRGEQRRARGSSGPTVSLEDRLDEIERRLAAIEAEWARTWRRSRPGAEPAPWS